jgi:uncharacterized protein (DUF924 family)
VAAPALTPEDLLSFWFGPHEDDAKVAAAQADLWWSKDAGVDREIAARFGALAERGARGELDAWSASPRGLLALVLLLDQLPRNVFRDTPRAFATDPLALGWCLRALALRADRALRPIERTFLYLPLEHSEELPHQERCVTLFAELAASVPAPWRATFEELHAYALRHREIIARFGRFPHRNAILGRPSTPAELAFLREPGSAF